VERAFGVLKNWFHVLNVEPFWKFKIQVKVVLMCYVLQVSKRHWSKWPNHERGGSRVLTR